MILGYMVQRGEKNHRSPTMEEWMVTFVDFSEMVKLLTLIFLKRLFSSFVSMCKPPWDFLLETEMVY